MNVSNHLLRVFVFILVQQIFSGGAERFCTDEEAAQQANAFFDKLNIPRWAACGSKKWLTHFHELVHEGDRHILDVGCNKGYESALFFDLLKPELRLTPEEVFKIHSEDSSGLSGDLCGVCSNCEEKADRGSLNDGKKHKSVNVYCFEPSLENFRHLLAVERRYGKALAKHNTRWFLYNAAVSNYTGITSFPRSCGTTLCSLHLHDYKEDEMDMVFVVSVDDFMKQNKISHLDILKIDTEGNDPAVFFGAKEAIKHKQIDLLYFEYHELGLWENVALKSVVSWFAGFDYVCYFEGTPTLARLTGCWSDRYEMRKWSNVVCTHTKSYLYRSMEGITFLAEARQSQ